GVTDCNFPNAGADHAGTPENRKASLVGGARGGGGANFTGGWSGTDKETIKCPGNGPSGASLVSASSPSLLTAKGTAPSVSAMSTASSANSSVAPTAAATGDGANLCPVPGTSAGALLLTYEESNCTGAGCNSQSASSVQVSGDPAGSDAVYIVATSA